MNTATFTLSIVAMLAVFGAVMFAAMYKDHQESKKRCPSLFK